MEGNRIDELKTALWSSDPWVADNHSFFCLHCGMKYNGDVPQGTHHANCIWLVNFQEVESGLTPRVPDVATCLCGGEYYTDKVLGVVSSIQAQSIIHISSLIYTHQAQVRQTVGWIPCQQGEMMEIKIVEITDENRPQLLHLAIAGYIGEKCRYCQHVYKSVDDITARNVVYAGESQYACKACFDTANPANTARTGQEPA